MGSDIINTISQMFPKHKLLIIVVSLVGGLLLAIASKASPGATLFPNLKNQAPSTSPQPTPTNTNKLQTCPDAWYKNEMPCVYRESPSECEGQKKEYFIINGERKEIEEVDIAWVKDNCEVNKPSPVY